MPLSGSAFWACVLPVEKTNFAANPSFERGTAGWAAYGPAGAGTVGTTADAQQFGAWAGSVVTINTSGTAGIVGAAFTAVNGSAYTVSAYVKPPAAVPMIVGVGDSSGNNLIGSVAFTQSGPGTWHRYSFSFTEAAGASRAVVIRKTSDPTGAANAFYLDGVQVEQGSLTTYIDGDTEGCTWQGAAHASQSYRSGQSRAGGSVVALADLGLIVDETPGMGMMPLENASQSYALLDGAQFQFQRAAARSFTLDVSMAGASLQGLHAVRRKVINAFKIDAVAAQQPTRFWYTGAGGTVQIDAVLDAGLEFNDRDGFMERTGVKFVAFDPYWRSTTQQGTALAPRVNLGSVNYIVKQDKTGQWGTLGANGTTVQGAPAAAVYTSIVNDTGTVFFGGRFGSVAGTAYNNVAMYSPYANTFGTLASGTISSNGSVNAFAKSPAGSLYVGGAFSIAAGTAITNIAQWNGAWGSLPGGTLNNVAGHQVWSLLYSSAGTLFIGGTLNGINGTTSKSIVLWNGAQGGTLTNGTVALDVLALAEGLDRRIYVGGGFVTAGGTQAIGIAQWNGAWGTLTGGTLSTADVAALAVGPDGRVYLGGFFSNVGGSAYNNIAVWNGVGFSPLQNGLTTTSAPFVADILVNQSDNTLLAGGVFNAAGSIALNDGAAQWNGYTWQSFDINLSGNGTVFTMARGIDQTLYVGGNFVGTATAASVTTIVNQGMAQTYPVVTFYNNSSGTARLTKLVNTTTNDAIYFSLTLQAQERATLDLAPGARAFTSVSRGNIFSSILPSSNLATWRLLPGTNFVTFLADNDGLQTSLYWTPRAWSADMGTLS